MFLYIHADNLAISPGRIDLIIFHVVTCRAYVANKALGEVKELPKVAVFVTFYVYVNGWTDIIRCLCSLICVRKSEIKSF